MDGRNFANAFEGLLGLAMFGAVAAVVLFFVLLAGLVWLVAWLCIHLRWVS